MLATQIEVSDGTLNIINVGIEFFNQSDISVSLDQADEPLVLGLDYQWSAATAIQFLNTANTPGGLVPAGVEVVIRRNTKTDEMYNIYDGGAPFSRLTLDENFEQLLRLSQEYSEGLGLDGLRNNLSMNGYRITELGDALNLKDAVNLGLMQMFVEDQIAGVVGGFGSFTQSGAGALERTFQDKMRDFVSKGDFVTAQAAVIPSLDRVWFVPDDANITLTVPTDVPTLTAALSAVAEWHIPASSFLTIKVNEGTATSETVVVDHPNAENILITGETMTVTSTITSYNSVTGSRGNFLVTLNVNSSNGLVVGDWVAIRGTTGTGTFRGLNGFYEVTAVGATTLQVRVRIWEVGLPAMTFTGGSIYKVKSLLKFANKDGIIIKSSAVTIYYLGVVGNMWDYWDEGNILGTEKGTHGVYVASNTIVDGTGTPGGANPYGLSGGGLACLALHVADFDQQGFTAAGGGGIFGYSCYASSCGRRGYYVGTSAAMEFRLSYASTNYRDGVIADYNGAFNANIFQSNCNRLAGGFANNGGSLICPNGFFTGNLYGIDIRAGSKGFVDASTLTLNLQNGASFEYGAGGSVASANLSDNGVDGMALIFGSAVRANNATLNNNGRYGINSLASFIGRSGATITGNVTANINNDANSVIFDGTNYEPTSNPVRMYEWTVTDSAKVHNTKATVNSIGDFTLALDTIARLVLKADGTLFPSGAGTQTNGRDLNRWSAIYALRHFIGATGTINIRTGTGSPEGNVTDVVGSLFLRSDGGASTTLYIKETGVGNTGWRAV